MKKIFFTILLPFLVSVNTFAQALIDDGAFLDPKYSNIIPPEKNSPFIDDILNKVDLPKVSPINDVIEKQTLVRSQAARGTCSIFSATAMLESQLIEKRGYPKTTDLSEEWLEYVKAALTGYEGSNSYSNFRYFQQYGSAFEKTMPYIGETWNDLNYSSLSLERCDQAEPAALSSCLIGHRDARLLSASNKVLSDKGNPLFDLEFKAARSEAKKLRDRDIDYVSNQFRVGNVTDIKTRLANGESVILDVDFYYGAWNHSKAPTFGISRNMESWSNGIVGYPESGSLDQAAAIENPAGHSVVVVGYDDTREVTVTQPMQNGTSVTKTYKGVYYFKNSWGTSSFGVNMVIDGINRPGYGMITQDYAHSFGSFYQFLLKEK